MSNTTIVSITEQCIDKVIAKFRYMPYAFYTEKAVHCYAYHLFFHEYGLGKKICGLTMIMLDLLAKIGWFVIGIEFPWDLTDFFK